MYRLMRIRADNEREQIMRDIVNASEGRYIGDVRDTSAPTSLPSFKYPHLVYYVKEGNGTFSRDITMPIIWMGPTLQLRFAGFN